MTLFEKSADPEDGRLMSQNNHLIGVWMPFFKNRTQSRKRWRSKVRQPLILQISPEIEASGSCCLVAKSCLTLCDPMNCSMPSFPVLHYLPEFAQTHVHWVGDAIQPSHLLSPPSPPALSLPQHQGLFQWVSSSHQVAKVLELHLQHQSFRWIFRVDFL